MELRTCVVCSLYPVGEGFRGPDKPRPTVTHREGKMRTLVRFSVMESSQIGCNVAQPSTFFFFFFFQNRNTRLVGCFFRLPKQLFSSRSESISYGLQSCPRPIYHTHTFISLSAGSTPCTTCINGPPWREGYCMKTAWNC